MMLKELEAAFKKKTLIPYFTYGDKSVVFSEKLVELAFDCGADIVELGIPFSDPIADGPVIQASHTRALSTDNVTLNMAFDSVNRLKNKYAKPIIFMVATNLVYQYGIEAFFKSAKNSKLNGVVIPDLPIESAEPYIKAAKKNNVAIIFLVSPICDEKRMQRIVKSSTGFVYLISSTGTTGERASLSSQLGEISKKIKLIKSIPVAVGFGISTPEQVKEVYQYADGAIIGSHLVKCIDERDQKDIISDIKLKLTALMK